LRSELLSLNENPEGRRVLDALGADRFLPTAHSDYRNLYVMLHELGLDLAPRRE